MYKRKSRKPLGLRGVIAVPVLTMLTVMALPVAAMAGTTESGSSELDLSTFETLEAVEIQAPVVEKVRLDGDGSEAEQVLDEMDEKNGVVLFADDRELTVPAADSHDVILAYNRIIRYEDGFTRNFTVSYNGKSKVAYCIEPNAYPPAKGSHTAVKYDNELMTKALYYSYGYPGYEKTTKPYLAKCSMNGDYRGNDGAYVISHILLSYFYDNKSSSSDAFKGVGSSTKNLIINMAADMEKNWPDVPEDASLFFDITQASAQWNKDRQLQETPVITLNGHRDNKISVTVPSGVTMIKLSGNELTEYTSGTGDTADSESTAEPLQVVDIYGGDEFYFTAPASVRGHFESGQMTGSLQDFQPYLIKVSNKQDILYCGDGAKDSVSFAIDWIDMGKFILNKVSASPEITENNEAYSLEGAKYAIYDQDGVLYEELITDAGGTAQVMLPYGEYSLKEKAAPAGYATDSEEISIIINNSENVLEHKEQILPEKTEYDNSPKTGDGVSGHIVMWVIAVLSATAAASVFVRIRQL